MMKPNEFLVNRGYCLASNIIGSDMDNLFISREQHEEENNKTTKLLGMQIRTNENLSKKNQWLKNSHSDDIDYFIRERDKVLETVNEMIDKKWINSKSGREFIHGWKSALKKLKGKIRLQKEN